MWGVVVWDGGVYVCVCGFFGGGTGGGGVTHPSGKKIDNST